MISDSTNPALGATPVEAVVNAIKSGMFFLGQVKMEKAYLVATAWTETQASEGVLIVWHGFSAAIPADEMLPKHSGKWACIWTKKHRTEYQLTARGHQRQSGERSAGPATSFWGSHPVGEGGREYDLRVCGGVVFDPRCTMVEIEYSDDTRVRLPAVYSPPQLTEARLRVHGYDPPRSGFFTLLHLPPTTRALSLTAFDREMSILQTTRLH